MRTEPLHFDKNFAMQRWNIAEHELPQVLIIQGQRITKPHLDFAESYLQNSRRLIIGDVILGQWNGVQLLFASGFGAALLADITHIAALLGVKHILILGTVGGLQTTIGGHEVIIPSTALRADGVSDWYLPVGQTLRSDQRVNSILATELAKHSIPHHHQSIISIPSMLCETQEIINTWHSMGLAGVDLETSAVFSVAESFGIPYSGMLYVIDHLVRNHDITKLTELDRMNSIELMKKLMTLSFDIASTL